MSPVPGRMWQGIWREGAHKCRNNPSKFHIKIGIFYGIYVLYRNKEFILCSLSQHDLKSEWACKAYYKLLKQQQQQQKTNTEFPLGTDYSNSFPFKGLKEKRKMKSFKEICLPYPSRFNALGSFLNFRVFSVIQETPDLLHLAFPTSNDSH